MRFKLFNTEIYVSFLFSAVIAFMLATDRSGLVVPTLFAVFIHEWGHLLAMWAAGCQPKAVRLVPASVQIVKSLPLKKSSGIYISLCGPAANFAVAAALFLNFRLFKSDISFAAATLNLVLGIFNLLPVKGLDGGEILCEIISRKSDIYRGEKAVRIITALFAAAALAAGVWLLLNGRLNISVFIVALYLVVCAAMKY